MAFQILSAADANERSKWLKIWNSWPRHDIFAHPEFVRINECKQGKAFVAVYKTDKGTIIYPFLKRPLGELEWVPKRLASFSDVTSSYGYGGAYYWGDDSDKKEVSEKFWKLYSEWIEKQCRVSEFIRFHLFEEDLAIYPGKRILRGKNVIRTLALPEDELWMDFKHKVRKNIKKAQRSGLECIIEKDGRYLDDFFNVYEKTMDRRKADNSYYFKKDYFREISEHLSDNSIYFHVSDGGRIVSTELIVYASETAYSFLGGTIQEAFDKRPNDLLKYRVMLWAKEQGISNYVLGGGYMPEDNIYRYKLSFAPGGEYDFYTGQRILNCEAYEELNMEKKVYLSNGVNSKQGYFPQYRA